MEDHLRFAVCYWHSFDWDGFDIFGAGTLDRPWHPTFAPDAEPMAAAKQKMEAAFEFFAKLGVPFYCFHDRDIAPEGSTFAESAAQSRRDGRRSAAEHQERTGVRAAVGHRQPVLQSPLSGRRRDQPRSRGLRLRRRPGGPLPRGDTSAGWRNYVLWGGREGYETLLNTDMRRELDQLARFLTLVVEHKQRIGFDGTILLEPKPFEPTKHQYDYDVAAVHAFLQRYDLAHEIKVNIEVNHATLAGTISPTRSPPQSTPGSSVRSTPTPWGRHGRRHTEPAGDVAADDDRIAAGFDPDLARAYGDIIGSETATLGQHVLEGPGVCLHRTTIAGRNFEYFSEDPYLSGVLGVAVTKAIQGHGVIAMAKHYVVNDQEYERFRTRSRWMSTSSGSSICCRSRCWSRTPRSPRS